ncbi:hypothetical protein [Fimbriimonas ginsengisoli]|uniref:Uncharacterized protein n=1 Tax=Fimbriimonas ginsengisoli Gsoil 348 TaxID=661478 RepID=A0A068NK44_FIMGI|nr:hypothetical protein [Fimbriimonas ginsengisoli]AIE83876.1 hypothetical protein OP10G_0508 [Fimbriimonas ginsengisoli Gsoil 348]
MKKQLALLSTLLIAAAAHAGISDRIYDFNDAFYKANGIDVAKLGGRKVAPSASSVVDKSLFPWQSESRIIGLSGGYNASGSPSFFAVLAGAGPDVFTADAAGKRARKIADSYVEYLFPSQGTDPAGLGALRQAVVLDTSHGYFSNDPLGIWLHTWVSYTDKAFKTKDGQKMLAELKAKNGLAKDGTPIIKRTSEIDNLFRKGFVTKTTRNDGLRYAICPVMKDPRNGAITKDSFLNYTKFADGSPVEPIFLSSFNNLQQYGDWSRTP